MLVVPNVFLQSTPHRSQVRLSCSLFDIDILSSSVLVPEQRRRHGEKKLTFYVRFVQMQG